MYATVSLPVAMTTPVSLGNARREIVSRHSCPRENHVLASRNDLDQRLTCNGADDA
jgi:hypothetical protein